MAPVCHVFVICLDNHITNMPTSFLPPSYLPRFGGRQGRFGSCFHFILNQILLWANNHEPNPDFDRILGSIFYPLARLVTIDLVACFRQRAPRGF